MSQGIAYRAGLHYLRADASGSSNPNLVRLHGKFYKWSGGYYHAVSNESIQVEATKWLARNEGVRMNGNQPVPLSTSFVRDVMLAITAETSLDGGTQPGNWIADQPGEAVGPFLSTIGGILDLGRLTEDLPAILPPNPNFFSLAALPHVPDAASGCPLFEAFLTATFGERNPSIQLVQEMFGYCLWPDCRFEMAFVLFGDANSGKSTVTESLTAMLGAANVSSLPLERLGDKFSPPVLVGKFANIVFDVGEIEKAAEGLFKASISGEPVPVEEKYQPVITARLTAKHILVTNLLPHFRDTSNGIWRRLQIVRFDRVCPQEQRDPQLKSRLLTEMPAITAWALQGLTRLVQQGHFTAVEQSRELLSRYRQESNPIAIFLAEECLSDPDGRVGRKSLYQHYKAWANDNGHSPVSSTRFYREVGAIHPQPDDPPRNGRGGDRMLLGLRLRHQADVFARLQILNPDSAEAS